MADTCRNCGRVTCPWPAALKAALATNGVEPGFLAADAALKAAYADCESQPATICPECKRHHVTLCDSEQEGCCFKTGDTDCLRAQLASAESRAHAAEERARLAGVRAEAAERRVAMAKEAAEYMHVQYVRENVRACFDKAGAEARCNAYRDAESVLRRALGDGCRGAALTAATRGPDRRDT